MKHQNFEGFYNVQVIKNYSKITQKNKTTEFSLISDLVRIPPAMLHCDQLRNALVIIPAVPTLFVEVTQAGNAVGIVRAISRTAVEDAAAERDRATGMVTV